jgi:release factor glutamine methyltransferase
LAKYLPQSRIIAVDISQKALDIAGENSRLNGVDRNIDFVRADLFDSRRIKQAGYDIIVSNPPYVGTAEIPGLAPEVRCQPEIALYAGEEGLDIYRRLIPQSADYLKPGGLLCLEIGYSQMDRVKEIFRSVEKFAVKRTVKDYNNIERVILARLNDSALS